MTYLIRGKNFEIGDRTKEKIEAVINGIEKLLPADAFINVAVNRGKLTYKTDITLKSGKLIVRSEKEDEDMMASVDKAKDNLEKQLLKIKGRKVVKRKAVDEAVPEVEETTDDDAPVIERNKKFEVLPMDVEEAVTQMELLGHDFFVFLNTSTEVLNVVYKRKNGNYGLIEPDI